MIVASVLRSGGHYSAKWVQALARGVADHGGHDFVCLTDITVDGVRTLPLREGWPGWFSKLELFRPGLFYGPVLYLDLDTLVVGDLTPFESYAGPLAMLSDFYTPQKAESGVMAWTPGPATERIWSAFLKDPWKHIQRYRRDGRFIAEHSDPDRLQWLYPQKIVSLKLHARRGCPDGATLVCGHGRPYFTDPVAGWAHEHWLGLVRDPETPARLRPLAVGSRARAALDDPEGDYLPPRTR